MRTGMNAEPEPPDRSTMRAERVFVGAYRVCVLSIFITLMISVLVIPSIMWESRRILAGFETVLVMVAFLLFALGAVLSLAHRFNRTPAPRGLGIWLAVDALIPIVYALLLEAQIG
jgi:hypothetical protein